MEINTTNNSVQALTFVKTNGEPQNWKIGQILQATVVSDVKNGLVSIQIGATILTAQVKVELQTGQKLILEIITAGDKPVAIATPQNTNKIAIESAIKQALSNQQNQAQLLNNLIQIVKTDTQIIKLPNEIQAAILKVLQLIPKKNEIQTPQSIKQAIKNSGIFLEAKLANSASTASASTAIQQDLKVALLRLQQVISQHPETSKTEKVVTAEPTRLTYNRPTTVPLSNPPLQSTATRSVLPISTSPSISIDAIKPAAGVNSSSKPDLANSFINSRSLTSANTSIAPTTSTSSPSTSIAPTQAQVTLAETSINNPNKVISATQPTKTSSTDAGTGLQTASNTTTANTATINSQIKTEAPFYFTTLAPIRTQQNLDNLKAAQRFSKLDSLGKILVQLLKDTDSSLARIQLNQLSPQHLEPEVKQAWNFEIPVRHENKVNMFEFNIKKDNRNASEDDPNQAWTIQISFNLEPLGQVHSKIILYNKMVSITFWAEQAETIDTFRLHMEQLQADLTDAGLQIEQLSCVQGQPPGSSNDVASVAILDEEA